MSTTCMHYLTYSLTFYVQQIVYDEVMDAIGPDRPIEHDDLPNLKFTERFLQETNRLFPVGPLVVRTNTGDIDLGKFNKKNVKNSSRRHLNSFSYVLVSKLFSFNLIYLIY